MPRLCTVGHGLANADEPLKELAEFQAVPPKSGVVEVLDGVAERLALDKAPMA